MTSATIVLYHDIQSFPTSLELALGVNALPESFAAHLTYFEKNYDLIDLDTLIHGPLPRRPLLLTFDDCYRSVLDVARSMLAPRGIPAVLFTNPDLLGPYNPSFDNVLSWFATRRGMPALLEELGLDGYPTVGALLSGAMSQRNASERQAICDRLKIAGGMMSEDLLARSPILTVEDLRELWALGVEIGNHTARHVHCRSLSADEQEYELVDARRRLEDVCGRPVRAFSVPYGNEADLTPEVLSILRASGHSAIFLVHARSNRFRPAPDVWYRVSMHDEKISELRGHLRLLPFLRGLKKLVGA